MHSLAVPEATPTIDLANRLWEATQLPKRKLPETDQETEETIGQRLARLRRERGMTQVELAERLDVAQPVVSDYERGELRLHGELIIKLSEILGVSSEELLGLKKAPSNGALRNRRLLRRLQQIERLPRRDQQALLRTIDRFLESFRTT
jgi:transcriptional regulator with XRE-family HTH domain